MKKSKNPSSLAAEKSALSQRGMRVAQYMSGYYLKAPMKTPRSFCYLELTICVCIDSLYIIISTYTVLRTVYRTKNIWFSLFFSRSPFLPLECEHFVHVLFIPSLPAFFYNFSDGFYNGHKLLVVCACVEWMYKENIENETENERFNRSTNESV